MAANYFRIHLSNLSKEQEDIITTHSFDCAASGVSESLSFVQPDLTYEPKIITTNSHEIDVFFNEKPSPQFFDGLLDLDKNIKWTIYEEESKDWLEEWKKGFMAFRLVDRFWIVPSWETVPMNCEFPIFIDPGMAFGTGTHATTQMASYFLNKFSKNIDCSSLVFLDVGTGTGLLAIMADKLGFQSVTGIEIDSEARRVALENITRNLTKNTIISDHLIQDYDKKSDVVIANITDGILLQIKDDLVRNTKEGGSLFLTGILKDHEDDFITEFIETVPLKVELRLEKDDWIGFWLKKISS